MGISNGKVAHGGWQECNSTLLGIGLKKIPLKFSSRPCRAKADTVNHRADIRARRRHTQKMQASRHAVRSSRSRAAAPRCPAGGPEWMVEWNTARPAKILAQSLHKTRPEFVFAQNLHTPSGVAQSLHTFSCRYLPKESQ